MDTIFIDEGFGSLDGQSLEYAIKTLMEINQKGRLVGIISHVDELKRIFSDCRLEVTRNQNGSSAKFFVT
jgi:exonuclease SbcC